MELGRIYIQLELALISQYQISLREEHLIFQFIWKNIKKRQVMDPSTPMIYKSLFHFNADWVEFYGDMAEEDLP